MLKFLIKNTLSRIGRLLYKDNLGKQILDNPSEFPKIILLNYLKNFYKNKVMFIVGSYDGTEIKDFFETKSISSIHVFDPVPRNIENLIKKNFKNKNKIVSNCVAVGDSEKFVKFYDTNLEGNGSILKLSDFGESNLSSYAKTFNKFLVQHEPIEVKMITLDKYCADNQNLSVDILWIDIQGAELECLKGAKNILKEVSIVHIEISVWEKIYINGSIFSDIDNFLSKYEFRLVQMGSDFKSGTGNAIYCKKDVMGFSYLKSVSK